MLLLLPLRSRHYHLHLILTYSLNLFLALKNVLYRYNILQFVYFLLNAVYNFDCLTMTDGLPYLHYNI
jgi:hypothetical protein